MVNPVLYPLFASGCSSRGIRKTPAKEDLSRGPGRHNAEGLQESYIELCITQPA